MKCNKANVVSVERFSASQDDAYPAINFFASEYLTAKEYFCSLQQTVYNTGHTCIERLMELLNKTGK